MDLEEIGMSAFDIELLKALSKDFYNIGREEGKRRGCSEVCGRLYQWPTR